MKKDQNSENLKKSLEERISSGAIAKGTRMPSLRKLSATHHVSIGVARRVMLELAASGYVKMAHGSGCFAAKRDEREAAAQLCMIYAADNAPDSYRARIFDGASFCAHEQNCEVTAHLIVSSSPHLEERLPELTAGKDGLIFIGGYDRILKNLNVSIPVVGALMHNSYGGRISLVEMDTVEAAHLAAEHFESLGLRKVVVFSSSSVPIYHFRAEQFLNEWLKRNHSHDGELRNMPEDSAPPPGNGVGLLFTGGSLCETYLRSNRDVNRDHVLEMEGKSLWAPGYIATSTICVDWHAVGAAAVEECLRLIRCGTTPARRIYINCRLKTITGQGDNP